MPGRGNLVLPEDGRVFWEELIARAGVPGAGDLSDPDNIVSEIAEEEGVLLGSTSKYSLFLLFAGLSKTVGTLLRSCY